MNASSKTWQLYKSGVVKENDGCDTRCNHLVVIVGYYDDEPDNGEMDCENWEFAEEGQRVKWFNYNPC